MAWLQERNGKFRIKFRSGGKPLQVGLGAVSEREANESLVRLEENLRLLDRGRMEVPDGGVNLGRFLLSDGKLNRRPTLERPRTLKELLDHYEQNAPQGAKESTTRKTEKIHVKHLLRLLGGSTELHEIDSAMLQGYASSRSTEKNRRGEPLSKETIRKELATLTTIANNWGLPQGFLRGPLSLKHVVYAKSRTKAPFQTWQQIERRISRQKPSDLEARRLWESVFLNPREIEEVLEHVAMNGRPIAAAMFCFAAYTGARRSEMVRAEIDDVDFDGKLVMLREKKRDRDKDFTFRSVPLTPRLVEPLEDWLRPHGGGVPLFGNPDGTNLTPRQAAQFFRQALKRSRWDVLPGWHCFRHSFASCLAAAGVSPSIVDSMMGHQTEAMRARYRHLFPENRLAAVASAFG